MKHKTDLLVESTSKKKKYSCKFQPSSVGNESVYCSLCRVNFSVASRGLYDVKRHTQSDMHSKESGAKSTSKSTDSFLLKAQSHLDHQAIVAETIFSNFIAEHNVPFSIADHFTELCSKMFPDSHYVVCYEYNPSENVVKLAKSVCTMYNLSLAD